MFEAAEIHYLSSGKRDSARALSEMFIQWAEPTQAYGVFSIRGTIPYVLEFSFLFFKKKSYPFSYLQNGNILAAKTFIVHFASAVPATIRLSEADSTISVGEKDDVVMTKDSLINFSQIAVLTCQRAQGDQNKVMRESWVRLCGTYQGKVGILASPEVRKV